MGKGDKRTKKGKRIMGTYGNSRKKKVSIPVIVTKKKSKAETEEATSAKKTAAKKTTTKKTAAKKAATAKEKDDK